MWKNVIFWALPTKTQSEPEGTHLTNLFRTAWRALSSIEQKEESKGSKYLKHLKEYKKKIETELN
jgi:hypothetical protein